MWVLALVAVIGLAKTAAAEAGTWHWGYNYLGNSTDNGACPSFLSPSWMLSPSERTWVSDVPLAMTKKSVMSERPLRLSTTTSFAL